MLLEFDPEITTIVFELECSCSLYAIENSGLKSSSGAENDGWADFPAAQSAIPTVGFLWRRLEPRSREARSRHAVL